MQSCEIERRKQSGLIRGSSAIRSLALHDGEQPFAATGFGCREIASAINAATTQSAPATKNAGR